MPISMPLDYIYNETGDAVTVTMVTGAMSIIGPDFFEIGNLRHGDYIVDFPDKSTKVISPEVLRTEYTEMPSRSRTLWTSIDDARSFAMEMQYAIDHPEEMNKVFSPKEITEAKAYIRLAKEYLAARDESLLQEVIFMYTAFADMELQPYSEMPIWARLQFMKQFPGTYFWNGNEADPRTMSEILVKGFFREYYDPGNLISLCFTMDWIDKINGEEMYVTDTYYFPLDKRLSII